MKGNLTDKEPSQNHETTLLAGKTYIIDMRSKELDSYIKLHDPTGKLLAEDDDGGDTLNARLLFAPTQEGTFRIVATSFMEVGRGAYSLTIRIIGGNDMSK